jgi:HAD superfamily hydrolase (TIGR01549 family)
VFNLIETVLFDCWGTILEASNLMKRGAVTTHFHKILADQGHEVDYNAFKDAYRSAARTQNIQANSTWEEFDHEKRLLETLETMNYTKPELPTIVRNLWKEYLTLWPIHSKLYTETMPLLNSLKARYKLGLVTNFVDGPTARKVFTHYQFEKLFESIIISGEVGYRKPKRLLFDPALSELNSSPDKAVMVGDTVVADVVGPKEIGMKAVLIDEDGSKKDSHHLADAVIQNIGELQNVLSHI